MLECEKKVGRDGGKGGRKMIDEGKGGI